MDVDVDVAWHDKARTRVEGRSAGAARAHGVGKRGDGRARGSGGGRQAGRQASKHLLEQASKQASKRQQQQTRRRERRRRDEAERDGRSNRNVAQNVAQNVALAGPRHTARTRSVQPVTHTAAHRPYSACTALHHTYTCTPVTPPQEGGRRPAHPTDTSPSHAPCTSLFAPSRRGPVRRPLTACATRPRFYFCAARVRCAQPPHRPHRPHRL